MAIQKFFNENDAAFMLQDSETGIQVFVEMGKLYQYHWYHQHSDVRVAMFLQYLYKNDLTLTQENFSMWENYEKSSVENLRNKIIKWLRTYNIELDEPCELVFNSGQIGLANITIYSPYSILITDDTGAPLDFGFVLDFDDIDKENLYVNNPNPQKIEFTDYDTFFAEWNEFNDLGNNLDDIPSLFG